ncbi:MAG: M15 family metallopeptidase, partial [Actinomycetota bacterium]|nr:M15 family metallopeptidase [Actinomycetota bacterium]
GRGWLVVHADVATDVVRAFRHLYAKEFPIRSLRLIDRYGGDDAKSMEANNSSAFNCRTVSGTSTWSQHSYGRAIDINPVQNPYVRGSVVQPDRGRRYLDRDDVRRGMIVQPGPVRWAFVKLIDWRWGGNWSSSKDYQHFSANGR